MITITQISDNYHVKFKYDPEVVNLIRQVPGRRWNPDKKEWIIPKTRLGHLLNMLKGTVYESSTKIISDEQINVNAEIESTFIPECDIKDVKWYVEEGSKVYQHQIDFMKFAIHRQANGQRSGFLVCDEQGLGKTLESMQLALHNKQHAEFKRCLIICCVSATRHNWVADINKHTNGEYTPYILGTYKLKTKNSYRYDGSSKYKLRDLETLKQLQGKGEELPFFIVTNIESLRYKQGKRYPITEKIIELINSGEIDMIILDEIHNNTSPTSQQGKQLLNIKKKCNRNIMWMPMTGTPITNKPTDVFLPLKLVDGHNYTSYYGWAATFCIYGGFGGNEIIGYRNISHLKGMLEGNMIRRRKCEVLDLPDKIQTVEYVENSKYQQSLYRNICMGMRSEEPGILSTLNPLAKFIRLRQVNGSPELVDESINVLAKDYLKKNAKLVRLLNLVDDIVKRNEKVVIFSNWVEPLRTLYRYIASKYSVAAMTGNMSDKDRLSNKNKFLYDNNCKILLTTIGVGGTGHTFTVAKNIIFYDEPWTAAVKEQAEDRIHRIGTKEPVNIITLITRNTVDDRVHDIVYGKKTVSSYIVDGQVDLRNHPELFPYLLADD